MSNENIGSRAIFMAGSLATIFCLGAGGFYWGITQGQDCIDALQRHEEHNNSVSMMLVNAECQFFDNLPFEPR